MRFEASRIDSARAERGFQISTAMKPLAAGGHLKPAQQQVESSGMRVVGCWMRIERATLEREPSHEYGGDAAFLLSDSAKLPVCGELLISPESAIRHTQVPRLLAFHEALESDDAGFVP